MSQPPLSSTPPLFEEIVAALEENDVATRYVQNSTQKSLPSTTRLKTHVAPPLIDAFFSAPYDHGDTYYGNGAYLTDSDLLTSTPSVRSTMLTDTQRIYYDDISITNTDSVPRVLSRRAAPAGDEIPAVPLYYLRDAALYGPYATAVTGDGQYLLPDAACDEMNLATGVAGAVLEYISTTRMLTHDDEQGLIAEPECVGECETIDVEPGVTDRPVLSLVGFGHRNYHHWVVDHLPKLRAAEYHYRDTGVMPTVLIPSNPSEWMVETLKLLGHWNAVKFWGSGARRADQLLVTHGAHERSESPNRYLQPAQLEWIHAKVTGNHEPACTGSAGDSGVTHLFVSRADVGDRVVANRDELLSALPDSFAVVTPGSHSFAEQVALFRGADVVVGVHGAGLTNILWCDDTAVIELFGEQVAPQYYQLAAARGHEYAALFYPETSEGIIVDPAEVAEVVGAL